LLSFGPEPSVFSSAVKKLRIFELKRDEVMGQWIKLHNEELHDLYSLPSTIRIIKSRRLRWAGHVAQLTEKRNVYRLLVVKPEKKRPLGRPRYAWLNNIRMVLEKWDGVMRTGIVWLRIGTGRELL
jgi:hypothetical protein